MVLPIYRYQYGFIHDLTPLPKIVYIAALFILALVFTHPLYLLILFMVQIPLALAARVTRPWLRMVRYVFAFIAVIVLINALIVFEGKHVLVDLGYSSWFGYWRITLEGVVYGCGMALRLLAIISCFLIFTLTVHPDELLKGFAGRFRHSALTVSVATRLYPTFMTDVRNISDALRTRGVDLDKGRLHARIKGRLPIVQSLLLLALERAINIGEAMEARGYGAGPRTVFTVKRRTFDDYLIISVALVGLAFGLSWALVVGAGGYTFYPTLGPLLTPIDAPIIMTLSLLISLLPIVAIGLDHQHRHHMNIR